VLRRVLAVLAIVGTVAGLVAFGVHTLLGKLDLPNAQESRCDLTGTAYSVSTEQAANAATVTAVAVRRKLPSRAAVIALATALQESKLINVEYGDRDSVGLFQQRPSQGWGSAGQILDPRYAAGKFYDRLLRVRQWQGRPLSEVAQTVQQSQFPEAYARWEDEATALARALSGATVAGVSCRFPPPTVAARPVRVAELLGRDLPVTRLASSDRGVDVRPVTGQGWAATSWLVTHADRLGIDAVRHAGRRWTRSEGWRDDSEAGSGRIRIEVADIKPSSSSTHR
jgi:hypothetical protein